MKKLIVTLLHLIVLAPLAIAADATPELTVSQAMDVTEGLRLLSKYEGLDKEGKPFTAYYKFSADLRMLIALNIDIGSRLKTQYLKARNDIVMQNVDDATGKVPDAKINALNIEQARLEDAPARVTFYRIKKEDLKLEDNPIPGPVLALIIPILDR